MLKTIEGMYRNGTRIDLRARGIDEAQAADLRARLSTFAEDWERPEMNAYDGYDASKARLNSDCTIL